MVSEMWSRSSYSSLNECFYWPRSFPFLTSILGNNLKQTCIHPHVNPNLTDFLSVEHIFGLKLHEEFYFIQCFWVVVMHLYEKLNVTKMFSCISSVQRIIFSSRASEHPGRFPANLRWAAMFFLLEISFSLIASHEHCSCPCFPNARLGLSCVMIS